MLSSRLSLASLLLASPLLTLMAGCGMSEYPTALKEHGGLRAVLRMDPLPGDPTITDEVQAQTIQVLEKRLNALAASETVVHKRGRSVDRLAVEIASAPGQNAAARRKLLETAIQPARLEFIWLRDVRTAGGSGNAAARYLMESTTRFRDLDSVRARVLTDAQIRSEILYKDPANIIITGADLASNGAKVSIGRAGVETMLQFNEAGTRKFAEFTRNHIGALLAIVLNGKISVVPRINDAITEGQAVITGNASTVEEAKTLADLLNAGTLPVRVSIEDANEIQGPE